MDHYGYIEWIEKLGSRYLPVEDRRTMKKEWRTSKNSRNLREILYRNVTETFWKRLGLDFLHGNKFSKQIQKREKCLRGWTLFHFTSPPIYRKLGEKLATQLTQASRVASSRSNSLLEESSGGPKLARLLFAPPFLLSTPPCLFFGNSFFVKLRKLTNFVKILVFFP